MNKINKLLYTALGVVIAVLFLGIIYKYTDLFKGSTINNYSGKTIIEKGSISEAVKKSKDAVVMIRGYKGSTESSTGTGFVYKTDDLYGYIMTNEHVINGCSKIVLVMSDDSEVTGKLLGSDEYLDLAVIRIPKANVKSVAIISTSENMEVGDGIFTIGSPLGYEYRGSVTSGILSGKDRLVSVSVGNSTTNDYIMKVLQIDAAINPGNSGGPLLNMNGEVIGVNSMKLVEEEVEGMGFAIPIEYALNYIDTLESSERIKWPSLGIRIVNIDESATIASKDITIPDDVEDGVVITKVNDNSPLKTGDIIIEINKQKIKDIAEFKYELYQFKENDTIEIKYIRDGKTKTAKIKLKSSN